jgi:hypothetical protein
MSPASSGDQGRALAYFAMHGIADVERLITDNAWAYRHSLRRVCIARSATGRTHSLHFEGRRAWRSRRRFPTMYIRT